MAYFLMVTATWVNIKEARIHTDQIFQGKSTTIYAILNTWCLSMKDIDKYDQVFKLVNLTTKYNS